MPKMTNRERVQLVLHVHELLFGLDHRGPRLAYELSRLRLDQRWDRYLASARFRLYGRGLPCLELLLDLGYTLELMFVVQNPDERDSSGRLTSDALDARRGDKIMWMKKVSSSLVEDKAPPNQGWIRVNPASYGLAVDDDPVGETTAWPAASLAEVPADKVAGLASRMKARIVGQDEALDALVEVIQRARVGLGEPGRPIGTFIFTGGPGVGKTTTARVLAEELMGSEGALVAINCSDYSGEGEVTGPIGRAVGQPGGMLFDAVRRRPFSVVLFDKIEKAGVKVRELLSRVIEDGRLTDDGGKTISFRETVVIMTSNPGVEETGGLEGIREAAPASALEKIFGFEFLGRISKIINFKALTRSHFIEIARLELKKFRDNFRAAESPHARVKLKFGMSLCDYLADKVFGDGQGARSLKRAIETEVLAPLTEKLFAAEPGKAATALVYARAGVVAIEFKEAAAVGVEKRKKVNTAKKPPSIPSGALGLSTDTG